MANSPKFRRSASATRLNEKPGPSLQPKASRSAQARDVVICENTRAQIGISLKHHPKAQTGSYAIRKGSFAKRYAGIASVAG